MSPLLTQFALDTLAMVGVAVLVVLIVAGLHD